MATFFSGTRGSGKSKYAVERMQNRLKSGRRVATNLDLFLEELWPDNPKASYTRLPDFPRSKDLIGLGKAYEELDFDNPETYDDKKFGQVVLDELLTSFNSRNWNDPDRIEVVNWIVQSRKYGWDLTLIGQSIDAVDKQIRDTVITELYCFRSSLNLFPGMIWKTLIAPWFNKLVPKWHMFIQYDGRKEDKKQKLGAGHFRRNDLHTCYKTGQMFKKDVRIVAVEGSKKPIEIDDRVTYTVLHPHYFGKPEKSNLEKLEDLKQQVKDNQNKNVLAQQSNPMLLFGVLVIALFGYFFIDKWSNKQQQVKAETPVKKVTESVAKKTFELGEIFINGSEIWTDGRFNFFFSNDKGQIIKPQNVGYKVLYINNCHVKLVKDEIKQDIYCNPVDFNWSSEPLPKEERITE